MAPAYAKLVHVLIGKSIAETILVGAIAVFTFVTVFPPYFHGWGEVTDRGIAGWAVNNAEPWQHVPVQLFIDGQFISAGVANLTRPDVVASGWASDPWHGYAFILPPLATGRHEARIYAMHNSGDGVRKSLQLLGSPLHFSVEGDGRLVKLSSQ